MKRAFLTAALLALLELTAAVAQTTIVRPNCHREYLCGPAGCYWITVCD